MTAIEFLEAIQNGAPYGSADIDRLIEDEFERDNAWLVIADTLGLMGRLDPDGNELPPQPPQSPIDDYDPNQPRYPKGHPRGGQWVSRKGPRGHPKGGPWVSRKGPLSAKLAMEYEALKERWETTFEEMHKNTTEETTKAWAESYMALEKFNAEHDMPHEKSAIAGDEPWRGTLAEQTQVLESMTTLDQVAQEYEAAANIAEQRRQNGEWDFYDDRAVWSYYDKLVKRARDLKSVSYEDMTTAELQAYLDDVRAKKGEAGELTLWAGLEKQAESVLVKRLVEEENARKLELAKKEYDLALDTRLAEINSLGLTDKTPYINAQVAEFAHEQANKYNWDEPAQRDQFVKEIKGADVAIAINSRNIHGLLEQDGFHNQHVMGESNGMYDPDGRGRFEEMMWGIGSDPDSESYPVYGFVTGPYGTTLEKQHQTISQYGDMVAILKPEWDEYVTVTVGDSLNNNMWWANDEPPEISTTKTAEVRVPTPKLDPNPDVAVMVYNRLAPDRVLPTPFNNDRYYSEFEYPEAQIFKRPTMAAIKEIRIPGISDRKELINGYRAVAVSTLGKMKRDYNIPILIPSPDGGWIEVEFDDLPHDLKVKLDLV